MFLNFIKNMQGDKFVEDSIGDDWKKKVAGVTLQSQRRDFFRLSGRVSFLKKTVSTRSILTASESAFIVFYSPLSFYSSFVIYFT